MNKDEALAFLSTSQGNQTQAPVQPESMSPDEVGPQLAPQVRGATMSQEDAMAFLGIKPKKEEEQSTAIPARQLPPSDPNDLTSNIVTSQDVSKPTGISKEDALAFLNSKPSATPEQTSPAIALPQATPQELANAGTQGYPSPASNQISKQINDFVTPLSQRQSEKRPVEFLEAAGRGLVGGLAKANELMAQGVGVFPYMEDKTLQAFGVDSDIYNRYIKAVHSTGLGQPGVEAEEIKPTEYLTTGGKIGQGLGEMAAPLPYMIASGGVGAEEQAAQEAFQVVKPLMTPIRQGIQSMLPMATQAGAETVQQSAQQGDNPVTQAAKGIASATATAVTGAIPLSMRSKIANPLARFLEQGAYGYITGLPVGESQKVVDSWINGKPYVPSSWKDMAIQAIPMAFMTGVFGAIHAPDPTRIAPSSNELVNSKQKSIEDIAGGLSEDATNTLNLVQSGTPASAFAPKTLAEAKAEIDKALEPEKPAETPVVESTGETSQKKGKWYQSDELKAWDEERQRLYDQWQSLPIGSEERTQAREKYRNHTELANKPKGQIVDLDNPQIAYENNAGDTQSTSGDNVKSARYTGKKGTSTRGLPTEEVEFGDGTKGWVEVGVQPEPILQILEENTKTKPAEAPVAEAQPEKPNAVQEQTTGEVGVRNAPTVGEGVGRENEAEVPATQGEEKPKEEVTPFSKRDFSEDLNQSFNKKDAKGRPVLLENSEVEKMSEEQRAMRFMVLSDSISRGSKDPVVFANLAKLYQESKRLGEVKEIPSIEEYISGKKPIEITAEEVKPEPKNRPVTGEEVKEEIGKNLLPEDRLFISDLAKDAKEKIISVGAASPEEFMQRYAIIGAKAIMDGHQSEGRFAAEIMKEIPSLNPDLIHDVYTRAGELINQLEFGGGEKPTPIQRFLEKKPKAPQETITINPKTELKRSLREQQKAGEAGYKRGVKETWNEAKEIISGLNEKIKNSITKAQALSEYLRGQEKGAKIATDTFRRNIKSADKILSLDQEDVRRDLTELVNKLLPPAERGRFIGAITKALKRPNILTGDPMTMYKNAANVMTAIRARADEVYRKGVIGEIRDTVDRALKSPTVDLQFKNLISKALKDVNIKTFSSARLSELKSTRDYLNRMEEEGKDVYIPKQILDAVDQIGKTPIKDLPIETLENLNTKLKLMERLGRMKFKSRQAAREAEEQLRMSEILKGDSMPLEKNPEFKAQPGEKLTLGERVSNRLARFYNATTSMDIAHLPQDVIFDWLQGMKGKYAGPLFDHIRTPMDSAYDAVQRNTSSVTDPLKDIIKHYKLTDQDEEKIGLWAQLQQERGEDVALETGVTPKTINDLKASGLTNGQKAAYNYMRRVLDSTLPRIQETMHDLYNVPVESIKNYFPWMRDYEKYNADPAQPIFDAKTGKQISQEELDSFSNLVGNLSGRNTAKTPQGFTIERKPGATPAIRYDAFDVFQRHMYNANRLIELQPTARMASKMINSDSFKEKFGDYGQQLLKEWMTHTVTDGNGNNIHRWQLLDSARRASSKGLVFYNLVSNIKHISAIFQGFVNAGSPVRWYQGVHLQNTAEGKAFLENFPQVIQRGAGELSFQELQKNIMRDPEGIFAKTMDLGERYGFIVGRAVDELNSRAVFIGRYLKNLEDKGLTPDLKGPINEEAAYNAIAYMRRTVSSTLPKDIQPVLGKGAGFGGNVSLARTMNAFKQFALERWSLMRYDIPVAFKTGNYTKGIATIVACLAAGIYETQLPGVIKGVSQGIFGKPSGQKEDKETWYQKLLMDGLTMIPYVSIPVSMALYKDAGIPIVDAVRNLAMSGYGVATAKTGEGEKSKLIDVATAGGEIFGVPGAAVLGKGAKAMFVDPELQKKEAAQVAKETRQEKAKTKTTAPHTIKTIGGIKPIKTIK